MTNPTSEERAQNVCLEISRITIYPQIISVETGEIISSYPSFRLWVIKIAKQIREAEEAARKEEREACAELIEKLHDVNRHQDSYGAGVRQACMIAAEAIRARSKDADEN